MVTVGMVDPWGQVVRECRGERLPWRSVALTYAFGLRQEFGNAAGISEANTAIIERFGLAALDKIKRLAWDIATGRKRP